MAAKLLKWRDSLIMAGWNRECDCKNSKLSVLAQIEKEFSSFSQADTWVEIQEILASGVDISDSVSEIFVDCNKEEIPYIILKTIESLENVKVTYSQVSEDVSLKDKDVMIVEFEDVNDAYEWISQVDGIDNDTAVINRDNVLLNHVLYTWNKPLLNSSLHDTNPQLLQLFKLGMSIFSRPLNVGNVLSYLQLPTSPVPSELRYKLSKLLLDRGGFGDGEWDKIIDEYKYFDENGKEKTKKTKEKKEFLEPVTKDYTQGIEKSDLNNYISLIQSWIRGNKSVKEFSSAIASQYYELESYFSSLRTALDSISEEKISSAELEKLVLQIYRSMSTSMHVAQKGAFNVVDNIQKVVTLPKTLIWLDCHEEEVENNPYDFLSTADKEYLRDKGVKIPDFASHLYAQHLVRAQKLSGVEKIILCKSAYNGITRLGEHSLIAEMKILGKPVVDRNAVFQVETQTKEKQVEEFAPAYYVEIGEQKYIPREESYTSIEKLVQQPFNYVTEYVAKLYEIGAGEIADISTTKGNVAHYFFEKYISEYCQEDYKVHDFKKWREKLSNVEDALIEESIDAVGLVLRLPENTIELNKFKNELKESILSLIDIMEHLHLSPVACELSIPNECEELELINNVKFGAKIDFLLINADRNYVIFDFKWSTSPKRYEELIKESKDMQLLLYKWAIEKYKKKTVTAVGYYLMAQAKLVTSDYDDVNNGKLLINKVNRESNEDRLEQIKKSIAFRLKELENGNIEESELLDILKISDGYYSNEEELNLYPLKVKVKASGRGKNRSIESVIKDSTFVYKKSAGKTYENEDNKNPNEVATTHKTLKGRLK